MIKIYRAINKSNGKMYIGQTSQSLEKRIKGHLYAGGFFHEELIKNYDNFKWDILEECNTREESNIKEKFYIKVCNTIEFGYNKMEGGYRKISRFKSIPTEWDDIINLA